MVVLLVIHGYPMRYNAGSEVYTQALAHALVARGHQVHVFTRREDPFAPDGDLVEEHDPKCPAVQLHVVNNPRSTDRYRTPHVDAAFDRVLDRVRPDVVHVGHLNHLSTSLVHQAAARGVPVVHTVHDFWLQCPRGQLLQAFPEDPSDVWALCPGQRDDRCAERCYARSFSGDPAAHAEDLAAWTRWVGTRMAHVRDLVQHVDRFLVPSRSLLARFQADLGVGDDRVRFLPYGFDHRRLEGRHRPAGEPFTFGYIGTHIPAKGIHHLLQAFGRLDGSPRLRIWGRARGAATDALHAVAERLPPDARGRVEWRPEYENAAIVTEVFDQVDAIVVPSIWLENAPLVIHEALHARVPVITADAGGMSELVHHGENGLLFRHRDPGDLATQMARLAADPAWAARLGRRGYMATEDGRIPSMADHARAVEQTYTELRLRRDQAAVPHLDGPWRITFDTNPDDCNLHCVMCEEHSPHSPLQKLRRAQGNAPRRMDVALVERVVAEAAPRGLREIIPSTMGEPLLYADFERILEVCRRHAVKLNLTTNGTFPRLGARAWAEKIVPVTSDVKISWNGATAETHARIMIGAKWEQVLDNVRTFVEVRDAHARAGGNRCRVTFQLTYLETNLEEIPDIVALAARLGVDRVKGHHLWAHFKEIAHLSMRRDADAVRRWNEAVRRAHAAAEVHRLPDGRRVLLENLFELGEEAAGDQTPGGTCPFLGQEAWINAAGRFDPCCAPDAERRALGSFGAVQDQGLAAIWQGTPYRALVAGYRTRDLCRTCTMRRPATAQVAGQVAAK